MKRFARFFVVALVVALVATAFAVSSSAAEAVTDPRNLKPASDKVVFIMDAPEGGQLPGDGTGSSPENPYKPIDHELYDPTTKSGESYQSSLYQATELLKETGGTVVVMGPVYLDSSLANGDHANTEDVNTAEFGANTIKFTSVYNGVDYREKNGAKLTVEIPAEIGVKGQSIWENIDIETVGANRIIHCSHYPTLFGEGIKCYPKEVDYANVASYYISVAGGHRYEGGNDLTPNVVIQSGTYNIVCPGIWGANNWRSTTTKGTYNNDGMTDAKLTLEGSTTVLGQVYGTTRQAAEFSGKTEIIINGGTYACDIFGVGLTGMTTRDGIAKITINGGDFSKAWTIGAVATGFKNNAPAAAIIDFTGWTGDKAGLAAAYKLAVDPAAGFTSVKLPENITADELQSAVEETTIPATEPPVTEPDGPIGGGNNNQGGVVIGTAAPDESDDTVDVGNDKGDNNTPLIIGIAIAAFVCVAAVVVVIIVLKKKKSAK